MIDTVTVQQRPEVRTKIFIDEIGQITGIVSQILCHATKAHIRLKVIADIIRNSAHHQIIPLFRYLRRTGIIGCGTEAVQNAHTMKDFFRIKGQKPIPD